MIDHELLKEVFRSDQPAYLYNQKELEVSVSAVRDYWRGFSKPGFRLHYSLKANPNPTVIRYLTGRVDGFDVSSRLEARLLSSMGIAGDQITWSGPAMTNSAIADLQLTQPQMVHVDSIDVWQALRQFERKSGLKIKKCLRLANPGVQSQKLGLSEVEIEKLVAMSDEPFYGLHTYLGRESFSKDILNDFLLRSTRWREGLGMPQDFSLYLGPGLPNRLRLEADSQLKAPLAKPEHVINLECGRALVQSSGHYATKVLAVKSSGKENIVIIDGGLQHMASQFKSPRYQAEGLVIEFFRGGKPMELGDRRATIHGSLSIWYDGLADQQLIPSDLKRGDWLVVNNMGAYGLTAASNQFLGPTPIKEWWIDAGGNLKDVTLVGLKTYHQLSEIS